MSDETAAHTADEDARTAAEAAQYERGLRERYPTLMEYAKPLAHPERKIVGRDLELAQLKAAMLRPELCNALLLAPAGAGKTTLVQALMEDDTERRYLEVDLSRMIANLKNVDELAALVKDLFDQAERYSNEEGHGLVIFMDEFHQLVQLSEAAVEGIKPVLAASGQRGLRIIVATTNEEFHKHIAPNQPLVERLQRISLAPPDEETTIAILRGMAQRYGVSDQISGDTLLRNIYEYTERYVPESSQPRKSIVVLDGMVGWHRLTKRPMSQELLADVLKESREINVAFRVNARLIEDKLNKKVYNQGLATAAIARRLQICVADLQDHSRPMASFLLTGPTGSGKTEMTKQLARLLFGDDQRHLIRFDMAEYAEEDSMNRFRERLTEAVWNTPYSVILLDEIEKSNRSVTRLLLSVLDDGELSNRHGRTTSFLNSYIVMTTNLGSEIYKRLAEYMINDEAEGLSTQEMMGKYQKLILDSIRTTSENFPTELINRINAVAPFQPLGRDVQRKVVETKIRQLGRLLKQRNGITLGVDDRVVRYLVDDLSDTSTDSGGARGIVRKLEDEVLAAIAAYINENPNERSIMVRVVGDLAYDNKTQLSTRARIVVTSTV